MFEITFDSPEGRTHALNQADLTCDKAPIFLSSWQPHFDAKKPQDTDSLDHPVWVQIADLSQVFRTEAFLREIAKLGTKLIKSSQSTAPNHIKPNSLARESS